MKKRFKLVFVAAALLAAGTVAVAQEANLGLIISALMGTADDVRVAIKAGADVNIKNDGAGSTALMLAACYNTNADVVKELLNAGSDVNARNERELTALMGAASENTNPDIVEVLIEAGADKEAKDKYGRSAIDLLERRVKSKFYGTDAYLKMRDLLD